MISGFDPAKDVIDLSHIDANLTTAGLQNFTFIGTAAFSGAGAQVRYQQDPVNNRTYVEADLAGDASPDLYIALEGVQTLTGANFALTSTQSASDLAAGAALSIKMTRTPIGSGFVYSYANVQGKGFSSFQTYYSNSTAHVADELNFNSTTDELVLFARSLTLSRGSNTKSLTSGAVQFPIGYHANETIQAGTAETFKFGPNFGNETISQFVGSGPNADTVQLATSSFSYLSAGMSQAADLAAVLALSIPSRAGTTIIDSAGDKLTLSGMSTSAITAAASQFHFV